MIENSQHLPVGYKIGGHYKIVKVLGQGGFGIVYKVEDTHQLNKVSIIYFGILSVITYLIIKLKLPW